MQTNSSGIKYFPINLHKKTMIYSGSQPQINFNPPSKGATANKKYEGYSIKLKKDISTNKSPEINPNGSRLPNNDDNLNKSANFVNKKSYQKYNLEEDNSNLNTNNLGNFTNNNNKSINSLYNKLNKLPTDKSDNYFIVNNIINNVHNDTTNHNHYVLNNQSKKTNLNSTEYPTNQINRLNSSHYNNLNTASINPKSAYIYSSGYNQTNKFSSQGHFGNSVNNSFNNFNNNTQTNINSTNTTNSVNRSSNPISLIIPKQVTPNLQSNKNSLIIKKLEKPLSKPGKKDKTEEYDKSGYLNNNTSNINNYSYKDQDKDIASGIRPSSKLAKIAETNIKSENAVKYADSNMNEKDRFEVIIKSSSIGKNQNPQFSNNKRVNETNKLNQSVKQPSDNSNNISNMKENTLLSTYNKMSVKSSSKQILIENNNNSNNYNVNYSNNNNNNNYSQNQKLKVEEIDKYSSKLNNKINNNNNSNNNDESINRKINKHDSFINKNHINNPLSDETPSQIDNETSSALINSPENIDTQSIPEHKLGKKSIKHYHQKSLSDNANVEGLVNSSLVNKKNTVVTNINNNNSSTYSLELDKSDEEYIIQQLKSNNYGPIKNCLSFIEQYILLDDRIEQNLIEKHVNQIVTEMLKINSDDYEFFNKISRMGLNKYINRILKYYSMLAMLIKFGILEFLLNNILQKKIKTILKIFNTCMYDFIYSTLICRLKNIFSSEEEVSRGEAKPIKELTNNFLQYYKRFQIKFLNNMTFEYQMKIYESKIVNQLKIFLDELFSENYYISYHAAFTQIITKGSLLSLEKLISLMNETFYTSLKVKSIENPFDFLAPGKGPSSNLVTAFPGKNNNKTLTLVLDLDETLVHFAYSPSGGSFIVRPGCFEFLSNISKYYEVMIFTAATQEYANRVINLIDPANNLVSYRLYRQHTNMVNGEIIKDLTKLNRDIKRILIVDNIPKNFKLQPNNGFEIKTWTGDIFDTHLQDFEKMLIQIHAAFKDDIRPIIKSIKQQVEKSQFPVYKKIVIS